MPNGKDLNKRGLRRGTESLSPGALTARRFFRNRLAVAGLVILGSMFLFSFLGGALSPYGQDQVFYRKEQQLKQFAAVSKNETLRFTVAPEAAFGPVLQAQTTLALGRQAESFTYEGENYALILAAPGVWSILQSQTPVALAHYAVVEPAPGKTLDFDVVSAALEAEALQTPRFSVAEQHYTLEDGQLFGAGEVLGYISRYALRSGTDTAISRALQAQILEAVEQGQSHFVYTENQQTREFSLSYSPSQQLWSVQEQTQTLVWDSYASPSAAHPLGTDKNGMDMLTRLMYGGRVSLVIGFIVVFISGLLGVVLGGIAGYFGKWVDNLLMRLVDVFYCIPSTPLLIILGAAMDGMRLDPQLRMLFLMLILGFLGWPSIARLVRGQILSLREQEFMTAAEAGGLGIRRRIFRHLIPNVIPQLIVTCTMSLGSTILTEATLSFLGLGVKFPFASWGNIMNDVSNAHVLTNYWFVWIPAGVCLVLSVLGFNFVGDGLRDAFDPKMKR